MWRATVSAFCPTSDDDRSPIINYPYARMHDLSGDVDKTGVRFLRTPTGGWSHADHGRIFRCCRRISKASNTARPTAQFSSVSRGGVRKVGSQTLEWIHVTCSSFPRGSTTATPPRGVGSVLDF
jgi:hypothetical protein